MPRSSRSSLAYLKWGAADVGRLAPAAGAFPREGGAVAGAQAAATARARGAFGQGIGPQVKDRNQPPGHSPPSKPPRLPRGSRPW